MERVTNQICIPCICHFEFLHSDGDLAYFFALPTVPNMEVQAPILWKKISKTIVKRKLTIPTRFLSAISMMIWQDKASSSSLVHKLDLVNISTTSSTTYTYVARFPPLLFLILSAKPVQPSGRVYLSAVDEIYFHLVLLLLPTLDLPVSSRYSPSSFSHLSSS